MADFDPQKITLPVTQWTGTCARRTFAPKVGSRVACVYIEASANAAAINGLLEQIAALADVSQKMVWTPTAEPGCKPSVDVRVAVRTDVSEA